MTPQNKVNNTGFSYDAAGNLTGDGSFSYTWDAESRMKSAAGVNYTYDGDDRRVQKSNGKLYWYGGGNEPIAETDAAGNNPVEYVFFGGKRIARRDASGNVNYYFADHLGTSRVVTSATGTILDDSDFYPFGGEHAVVSSSGNNYKFTGKERDAETGLDYLMARYYSSGFGRFASPDAFIYANIADPQSLNQYTYVYNNPLRFTDPTGHLATGQVGYASEGVGAPNFRMHPGGGLGACDEFSGTPGALITSWELTANGEGTGIFFPSVAAAQAYIAAQQPQNQTQQSQQQSTAPANSRTDVVLHGREYTPTPQVETPALWVMDWTASACSATGCSRPTAANENQTISLVESVNGGPWKKGGDPSQGVAHDHFSVEPRTINQHWFVDGKRVQLVVGKDSKGNLIKTWEVRVDIKKFGDRPVYSAVP